MPKKIDVLGLRFGRLIVCRELPKIVGVRRTVECLCDCGKGVTCDPRDLRSGHTSSCGCLQRDRVRENVSKRLTTHGRTNTREYNIWIKMKGRCKNSLDAKFNDYGGRGISICARWDESFEAFLEDMGDSPSAKHSIERENVNGNYEPGNCRWALPLEQARNKRNNRLVEYQGRSMPLSEACELAGVNYRSALYRLNRGRGWAMEASHG